MNSKDFRFKDEDGYLVSREWEDTMIKLLDKAHIMSNGAIDYPLPENLKKFNITGDSFENEIFIVNPYDYGADSDEALPNFIYKPTGYAIKWYKYAFRASYANKNITFEEFNKIINHCIDSLPQE